MTDRKVFKHEGVTMEALRAAHADLAEIAVRFPKALPVFERLDRELRIAEAREISDPIAAARAMLAAAQNATR